MNFLFQTGKQDIIKQILADLTKSPDNGRKILETVYDGGIEQLQSGIKTYYKDKATASGSINT